MEKSKRSLTVRTKHEDDYGLCLGVGFVRELHLLVCRV